MISPSLLLTLAVVILLARAAGLAAERLRQPAVVGEIVAGTLLGPSLLGAVSPKLHGLLLSEDVVNLLDGIAQLGLIILMVLIGAGTNRPGPSVTKQATGIALGASLLPILAGMALGASLVSHSANGNTMQFILFMGVALQVTALPVLARVLQSFDLTETRIGSIAMASAAATDVFAWLLLAVVLSMTGHDGPPWWVVATGGASLALLVLGILKPALSRLVRTERCTQMSSTTFLALTIAGGLLCAWFTQALGLHALFGAFLFGHAIPQEKELRARLLESLSDICSSTLLPPFFVVAGAALTLQALDGEGFLLLAVVLVIAVGSKFAGAGAAALLCGLSGRDSLTLGVLMNTRGLTELVVLSIGLSSGILDQTIYTVLVTMTVITTLLTGPWLIFVCNRRRRTETKLVGQECK